jgi:hypothetical protein
MSIPGEELHIVGHGDPGVVKLGTALLDSANLNDYANELRNLGQALTQDGDILLYQPVDLPILD